jgi:hypothetical protein
MSANEGGATELDTTPTEVTLPEPATGDDGGDAGGDDGKGEGGTSDPAQQAAARGTRKERRENALRTEREGRAEAERKLQAALDDQRQIRDQLAELRGRQAQMQWQQTQQAGDPVAKEIEALESKAERHLANAAQAVANKDEATRMAEMREYNKALRSAGVIEARQQLRGEFEQRLRQQPDPEQAGMKVALGSEFPWVRDNSQARDWADGAIAQLIARGRPDTLATYREALAMAAKEFGLGGAPERPSEGRRAAYSGISSREGDGEGGRTTLRLEGNAPEQLKKLAAQMYPSLDADQAYSKWLKEIGPGLAKR